jgi:hypothetical protein
VVYHHFGVLFGIAVVATLAGCASTGGRSPEGSSGAGGREASGGGVVSGSGGSGVSGTGGGASCGGGSSNGVSGSGGSGNASGGGSSSGGAGATGGSAVSTPTRDASTDVAIADARIADAAFNGVGDVALERSAQPPPACAGLFCDDFESGGIDPNLWNVRTSGGQTVVVQRANVAHGTYAVQFHAQPNIVSYDFIMSKSAPAELRGHHFGRAYFFVTPRPPAAHTVFLFAGSSGFPRFKYLEVAGMNNTWQLTSVDLAGIDANSASLPGTTEAFSSGGALPLAQWICLEWEFNDAPDQIRVFVNGTQDFAFTSILLNGVSTGQVGGFTDFGFGYYAWHPATYVFDIYYDDIVLDTKRVGCLP